MQFRMAQHHFPNRHVRATLFARMFLLSLLLTVPSSGIGQRPSGAVTRSRPNIVFILIDDLRWDELGIAGHPFIKTPNIDRIGKRCSFCKRL